MMTRQRTALVLIVLATALLATAALPRSLRARPGIQAGTYSDLYLPLAWRNASADDLRSAPAVTLTPTWTPAPTGTPTPTSPPTITPTPSATPTATEVLPTGRIHGLMLYDGEPMAAGFGLPLTPQIELRKRVSGEWETVANTVTEEGGTFEFVNPPPLAPGEVYQVWWRNDPEEAISADLWVHRWWSRLIASFGDGTDVDVGVFELGDLTYVFPCHDCHRTLPITFKWNPRANKKEVYRWSLFKECGTVEARHKAYRTQSLGHAREYTLDVPPPGFMYDELYCWYIFIEDGENGTGWPYYDWRTKFLSQPPLSWPKPFGQYALRLWEGLAMGR